MSPGSPALGQRLDEIQWPPGSIVVAASERRELVTPRRDIELRTGERLVLLVPIGNPSQTAERAVRTTRSA
ncbi:MAG: TrkA C-terminal domain-containing protein, partial [Nitrososphaerales archaeon]